MAASTHPTPDTANRLKYGVLLSGEIEATGTVGNVAPLPPSGNNAPMAPKPKRKYVKVRRASAAPVKLIQLERKSGITFVARYQDPETGAWKQESLTAQGYADVNACRARCAEIAAELAEDRKALRTGKPRRKQTPVATAIAAFVAGKQAEAEATTLLVYKEATDAFAPWAAREGLRFIEDVDGPKLFAFRNWLIAQPAHGYVKQHGKKGECLRVPGTRKLSPQTINKKLRAMRSVCGWWRVAGICPHLHTDLVRDALKFVKGTKAAPRFLKAHEVRALLEAVARHDARLDDGMGHHHLPIGDFVLGALLSGARFSELTALQWTHVDLDAGEIHLPETITKTGHARDVELRVSPALAAMLTRRRLQAAGNPWVFGSTTFDDRGRPQHAPMRRDTAEAARKRLVKHYNAPRFQWHLLRKTCGTFLTCAPGIFGGASAYMSAKQLGHGVAIAERHYTGRVKDIDPAARDLETAIGIVDLLPAPLAAQVKGARDPLQSRARL